MGNTGGFEPRCLKRKKESINFPFSHWYARRDWLRRHGAHSPKLTGVLKSAFRLWSNPFSRVLSLMALKTKNSQSGVFFVLVRAQGLASPPRRSFANAHRRPKVRLSLVVEPFSQGSLPYGAKNKKLPFGSLFCFGTRAGIRTLDPLIKSQLL